MKAKILGFLCSLILLAASSKGQTVDGVLYTNFNNYYKWRGGAFDSTLLIPTIAASIGRRPGAIYYKSSDSSLYSWTGSQWRRVGQGTDTTSLSNRIDLRVKYTDTAAMLSPYLRSNVAAATYQPIGNYDTATVVKAYVTNAEAVTITKGQVVYIFGASGDRASVKLAKNTSDTFSSKTLGIVRADIAAGQAGWITTQGQVSGINLGAYSPGDVLWLDSVAGGFTKNKPQAPKHSVFVGVVERANAGNGLIYVKPQNGVPLSELHDVRITSIANNEIIRYNSSLGYWENKSITTTLGYTPLNVTDTTAMLLPYLRKVDTLSLSNRITAASSGAIAWDGADSLYSSAQLKKGTFRTYDFDGTSGVSGIPQGSGDAIYMAAITASGTFLNIRDNNINGISISTGGSATSNPYLANGYANSTNVTYDITGSNIRSTWAHFRVRIPTLNDGTQRFYTVIGWKASASANDNQTAYFTYDLDGTQTGSSASVNWQTVSALGGNREWTTTSSAVPANTWQTLSIRATTTAIQFYIDGTLVSTHTTRIPATGRMHMQIFKTNGTTARFLDVDYATFNQLNQSDR
jgi:hypothetical protein